MGVATTAAVIGTVGALGGAALSSKGARDAARDANRAGQSAIDEQRAAREQFQQNIDPYLQYGNESLTGLRQLMGGDYSGFEDSPDYVYARDQAQQGIERGAAARGSLYSGGTNVDLANALNGIASQNLNAYRNFLLGGAQLGQNSAVGAGSLGQQSANAIGNIYGQIGQANADARINQTNAWVNGLSGLTNAASLWAGARSPATAGQQPMNAGLFGASDPQFPNWSSNLGSGLNYAQTGGSW